MESFSGLVGGVVSEPKGTRRTEANEPVTQLPKRIRRGKQCKIRYKKLKPFCISLKLAQCDQKGINIVLLY